MEPFIPKPKHGPEYVIQKKIMSALRSEGWYCKETKGNEFMSGWPDLFACNTRYGSRWIEVKCPTGYRFTVAQEEDFRSFTQHGSGVWVLTSEHEIWKLHKPPNWYEYLRWNTRSAAKPRVPSKKPTSGPEQEIQDDIIATLRGQGWFVKSTVGTIYSQGFPDLYATHPLYRARWIEVKNPKGYVFTPAQITTFPLFTANGVGVWVLTSAKEIPLLFGPHNWWKYLS